MIKYVRSESEENRQILSPLAYMFIMINNTIKYEFRHIILWYKLKYVRLLTSYHSSRFYSAVNIQRDVFLLPLKMFVKCAVLSILCQSDKIYSCIFF